MRQLEISQQREFALGDTALPKKSLLIACKGSIWVKSSHLKIKMLVVAAILVGCGNYGSFSVENEFMSS